MKAKLVEDRLELLGHEMAEGDAKEIHQLVFAITMSQRRLRQSFLE
jgi:hypothetical protein